MENLKNAGNQLVMKNQTRRITQLFAIAAALALSSSMASATLWDLQSSLDPIQAGVAGTGTGFATLTLDDVSNIITVTSGTFSGLSGNTTIAHIHGYSGPGVSSSPVVNLTLNPVSGSTSGTFSGSGTVNSANVLAGLTYINIHSSTFGAGEIRGQVTLVPEPSSLAFAGLGIAGIAARVWSKRRAKIS